MENVNLVNLEKKCQMMQGLRKKAHNMEREIRNELNEMEKELFNGMSYGEYVMNLDKTITVGNNITIKIKGSSIEGYYKINARQTVKVNMYVHTSNGYIKNSVLTKASLENTETPMEIKELMSMGYYSEEDIIDKMNKHTERTYEELPKKYKEIGDILIQECLKYKITNPIREYEEKYKISM